MDLHINELQINDWSMRRFTVLIFSILIVYISISLLETLKICLPDFKAFFGVLILLIPGFIILRILNLHELGLTKSFTFSIGLSLALIMIIGLILNQIIPLIGILKPLTQLILQLTFIFSVIILLIIAYLIDNDYKPKPSKINLSLMNPYLLLIILNLFIGVIGVNFAYYLDNNLLLMIFILIISLIPIFVVFNKFDSKFYPFVIFITSLALLYHVSLFSPFLVGTDIFGELWQANLTYINQIWDVSTTGLLNSVLSITILPPIFSIMCGFDNVFYLKYIAPFFFSLVPVVLYSFYENAIDLTEKEKLLAVFFVISLSQFFFLMIGLARQQIAELFFVLLLWLIVDKKYNAANVIVFILFTFALVCSHYSLAYIFLFYVLSYIFLKYLISKTSLKYTFFFSKSKINLNYILLLVVLIVAWQIYVSYGSVLGFLVGFIETIFNGLSDIFTPQANVSVKVLTSSSSKIFHTIFRYIFYSVLFFIVIGMIDLLQRIRIKKEVKTFEIMAISSCAILGIFVVLPFAGFSLGFERIFQVTSLILAPYMVLGFKRFLTLIKTNTAKFLKFRVDVSGITLNRLLALFLAIFFLFNSGFVYEIVDDDLPNSIPLSMHHAKDITKIEKTKGLMYLKVQTISSSELSSAEWFIDHYDSKQRTFTAYGSTELYVFGFRNATIIDLNKTTSKGYIGYFYLNSIVKVMGFNILRKRTSVSETKISQDSLDNLNKINKIYSNTGNDIFLNT
ncbi:MAG: DUF2206 domain-containing protein [Methanobacteriaceae archaeon]|nr:DUF2206 domain-containing protein [Methanobacteriaceae archaeon]